MKLVKHFFYKRKQTPDPVSREIMELRKELAGCRVSLGREFDGMIESIHLKWSKIEQNKEITNESISAL